MQMIPRVVDISHYNRVGAAGPSLAGFRQSAASGIWGIIHKATEARVMVDAFYAKRRQAALDAGLLWGAYHFLRPGDPYLQAQHFVQTVDPDAKTLMAIDHEDRRVPLSAAKDFFDEVLKLTGRECVLYSGFLIKEQIKPNDTFWGSKRLWLSHYSANPSWPRNWREPWLIQYTGDGLGPEPHSVPGIDLGEDAHGKVRTSIDVNHYAGTREQLEAEWPGGRAKATS